MPAFATLRLLPLRDTSPCMAQPPVLTLADVRLSFGGKPIFEGVEMAVSSRERAVLVGRNGAGKSTLMKIISGHIDPDEGEVWTQPGIHSVYLAQEPDLSPFRTLSDFAVGDLTAVDADARHVSDAELMALGLDPDASPEKLSGGQKRRAAIARAFAADPDILLLDEPTNHLDIPAIELLESRLKNFKGAILLVSHDRRFLENVSTSCYWLRQGLVRRYNKGFAHFEDWAAEVEAEEQKALDRLETQLRAEKKWLERGVTARRKRNQGRLRKVMDMRASKAEMKSRLNEIRNSADFTSEASEMSGRKVIETRGLTKAFQTPNGSLPIVTDLTMKILRGDRIGLIGPNGVGKSTLLKLLLGEISPDSGSVKVGTNLDIAYLDQSRSPLKPKDTLWETLAPLGGDTIDVRGRQRHVAAYAKDFLFKPEQLRQPVGALSGGERNRLYLAITLARPSNLLILDEPTNDLDTDTLDLLEDMLIDYEGTLMLVSHDRAFLDNVVTSCLTPVGGGTWMETPGGYSDAMDQLAPLLNREPSGARSKPKAQPSEKPKNTKQTKLSFKDKHRLEELARLIPETETRISELETTLADPDLYARDADAFHKTSKALEAAKGSLDDMELEWLELEEKREALEGA